MAENIDSSLPPQDSPSLDETDLALIHALQIAPRASWILVGSVLGVSPVTAARRWERLVDAGLAWVSCIPGPTVWAAQVVAFVEIRCEAEALPSITESLALDPRVVSIEMMGPSDLFLTVFAADLPILSRFSMNLVGALPGVLTTNTWLGTGFYAEGGGWRLDALDPQQQSQMARSIPSHMAHAPTPDEDDRALLLACIPDGRRSAVELAELTESSPSTVRRRLKRMVRGQLASFRCEVASHIAHWPISATYWASTSPRQLPEAARILATIPEVRLSAAVAGGSSNLVLTAWLRSLADSQGLEQVLTTRVPDLTIDDRAVAMRIPKRVGWLLDDFGRAMEVIPIDPWHIAGPPNAADAVHDPTITPDAPNANATG